MEKTCSKCGEVKDIREFGKRKHGKNGLASHCRECAVAKQQAWVEKNYDKCKAARKARYDANPEKSHQQVREWRHRNADHVKEYYKKWRDNADRFVRALQSSAGSAKKNGYARCTATVDEIRQAYTGRCAICEVPEAECKGKFHMDHNHETGSFNGWLCGNCNKGLGMFHDKEELLAAALSYLQNLRQ